jgi:hypothetical protein
VDSVQNLINWLQVTPFAEFMQTSWWGFPTVESIHVIAIVLVFGVITIVDLRLVGVASKHRRFTDVARDTLHWTWLAFGLAVVTGAMMFAANPQTYFNNNWFRWKMVFLVLAGINMLIFELVTVRTVKEWDTDATAIPLAARMAGFLSMMFWFAVVVCGRWIGFTLFSMPF